MPTIQPGSHTTLTYTLDRATRSLALLAEFAQYSDAASSLIYSVKPQSDNRITLYIDDNHLRLANDLTQKPSSASGASDGSE